VRSYRIQEDTLAYFKIIFQNSWKDSKKYKENLVGRDGNPIDIRNLNLTNMFPSVLSVQDVIQRAVILKLMDEKTSGYLTADIPGNILPSRKSLFVYKEKRRKIRVKKIKIRKMKR